MEGRRSEEIFADQRDVEDPDITIGQDGETLLIRGDAGVGDHATNIEAGQLSPVSYTHLTLPTKA